MKLYPLCTKSQEVQTKLRKQKSWLARTYQKPGHPTAEVSTLLSQQLPFSSRQVFVTAGACFYLFIYQIDVKDFRAL